MKTLVLLLALAACALAYTAEYQPAEVVEVPTQVEEHHGSRQKRYIDPVLGGLLLGKSFILGSLLGPGLFHRRGYHHGYGHRVSHGHGYAHHAPQVIYTTQNAGWGWQR